MNPVFQAELEKLKPHLNLEQHRELAHLLAQKKLNWKTKLHQLHQLPSAEGVTLDPGNKPPSKELREALQLLIPWRKGPYYIGQEKIDSEWDSGLKYDRLKPHLDDLSGKVVLDLGCNNGYYMFRLDRDFEPAVILGLDPVPLFAEQYLYLINSMRSPRVTFLPLGWDVLPLFPKTFDLLFNFGLLYHHTDPVSLLKNSLYCLKKKGVLWLETMIIPGDTSSAIFPEKKYMGAKGFYFLPTLPCLYNWLKRAGAQHIQLKEQSDFNENEQRKTSWAPFHNAADFIDKENSSMTVEGLPVVSRVLLKVY